MRSIIRNPKKKGAHMSSYLLQILKKKGLILLRDWVLLTPPSPPPPPPSMLLRGEHAVNGVHLFMVSLREREREREKINTTMEIMILSIVWGGGGKRKLNNKSV